MSAKDAKTPLETATEQGFLGTKVDPTPNEHYTVAGQVAAKPTPETDAKAKAAADEAAGIADKK